MASTITIDGLPVAGTTTGAENLLLSQNGKTVKLPISLLTLGGSVAYKGAAITTTDPGTVTDPTFYTASSAGTYANFKDSDDTAIVVDSDEVFAILSFDGTAWVKQVIDFPQPENKILDWEEQAYSTSDQVNYNGQIWKANEITTATDIPGISDKWDKMLHVAGYSDVGISLLSKGTNIISDLNSSSLSDTSIWTSGFLRSTGAVSASEGWYYTKDYISVIPGEYDGHFALSSNASVVIYDADKAVIGSISNSGGSGPSQYFFDVTIPSNGKYIRISHNDVYVAIANIYLKTTVDSTSVTNDVFSTTSYVNNLTDQTKQNILDQTDDLFNKYGFQKIESGTNLFEELAESDLNDSSIWIDGRLSTSGSLVADSAWKTTTKYYRIYPGDYHLLAYFTGTAKGCIYDKDKSFLFNLSNPTGSDTYDQQITIPEDGFYIRIPQRISRENLMSNIVLTNNDDIYINGSTVDIQTSSDIKETNDTVPVNGLAVSLIFKDILKNQRPTKNKKAVITLMTDDARSELNDWLIPLYDSKGVKATIAVPPSLLDTDLFITRDRCIELYSEGYDIANHTYAHQNLLTLDDLDAAEYQVWKGKTELLTFMKEVPMFVAPQGGRNSDIDKIIRKYHKCDFITQSPGYVDSPIDSYYITRSEFDATSLDDCKSVVDYVYENNLWTQFVCHPQYDEYSLSDENGQTRRDELGLLIDYIRSKDIPILTASQAFDFWKNNIQIGNARLDARYYVIGMDGSDDGNYFSS